jgi:hypothetical protein
MILYILILNLIGLLFFIIFVRYLIKIFEWKKPIKEFLQLIYYRYNPKEVCSNIYYWFYNFPYRFKMARLFKHFYNFDICEDIPNVLFAMFEEFYNSGIDSIVNWSWDDNHKKARQIMENAHTYIQNRKKWRMKADHILSKSTRDIIFVKDENPMLKRIEFTHIDEKKDKKISEIYDKIEERLSRLDEKYAIEIIKIRDYLWT